MKKMARTLWLVLAVATVVGACSSDGGNGAGGPDVVVADIADSRMQEDELAAGEVAEPPDGGPVGYDLYLLDNIEEPVEPFTLLLVDPAKGKTSGEEQVVITGTGFETGMRVFFGFQEAPQVYVLSKKKATVFTPAGFPGPVTVEAVNPGGGKATLKNGFVYYNPVQITSIEPAAGPVDGGMPLVVTGSGFSGEPHLVIGQQIAIDTKAMDDATLLAVLPPGPPGLVNVSVSAAEGSALLVGGFYYYEYPELEEISPAAGSATGGAMVQIKMKGAHPEAKVFFGDEEAPYVGFIDFHSLEVITPPAEVGFVDLSVVTPYGSDTRPDGFFYYGGMTPPKDLQIVSVQPASGPTAGGNQVTISAFGLTQKEDTTVLFGAKKAEVGAVMPGLMALTAIAPPGAAGGIGVTVMNSNGTAVKEGAYTYLPVATVQAVTPNHGPAAGGTQVAISGSGFLADAELFVGALPAYDVKVVSSTLITARTPMGSPGAVDVKVKQAGTTAVAAGAFTYEGPLGLFVVSPGFGAISGGTFITLVGSGFQPGAQVLVAGAPCSHVTVEGYNVITAKTPPGVPGTFDVEVVVGGAKAMLPLAFSYFDPTSFYGGTWGGEIISSVNVTVLDGNSGAPLADAFVMLWSNPDTPYQGYTDLSGQVTFSGPDLMGEQMVTASKECYSNSSVVEYNATNVTLYITYNCPASGGGGGGGNPPPIIKGRVIGLGKYVVIPPGKCNYSGGDYPFLCQSCSGNIDCGSPDNLCANLGDQGKKCLTACVTDAECPLGFACTSMQGSSDFGHCLPLGGKKITFCSSSKGHFLAANPGNGKGAIADGEGYYSLTVEFPPPEVAVICLGGILPTCYSDWDCTFGDSTCFQNGCWMSDGRPEMTPYAMGVKRHVSLADFDGDGIVIVSDVLVELDVPMSRKVNVFFDTPHLNWNGPNAIFSKAFVEFGSDGVFEFIEFPVKFFWDNSTTLVFEHLPNSLKGSLADTHFAVLGASVTAGENSAALPKTFALLTDLTDFENDTMFAKGPQGWAKQASGVKQNLYAVWGPAWTDLYGVGMDGAVAHFNGFGWQIQQSPGTKTLRALWGADGQAWAVGDGGEVVRFLGTKWELLPSGKANNFTGVWAASPTFVVVVGEYLITLWDGTKWSSMPGAVGHRFNAVWGINPQNLWAVGEYGKIVRFQNGSWVSQPSPTAHTLRSVWGTSPSDVWAVGDNGTVVRFDGLAWNLVESGTLHQLNGVRGTGPADVHIVGNKGTALYWDGTSLLPAALPKTDLDLLALHAVKEGGQVMVSANHQVVVGPFVSPVTLVYPTEGATLDQNYLQWQVMPGGPDASFHWITLEQPSMMGPIMFWDFTADGDVTYVDLPDFPNISGTPGVPAGFYIYTVQRVFKEGFDINNYDFTDFSYPTWRSWSYAVQTFVSE